MNILIKYFYQNRIKEFDQVSAGLITSTPSPHLQASLDFRRGIWVKLEVYGHRTQFDTLRKIMKTHRLLAIHGLQPQPPVGLRQSLQGYDPMPADSAAHVSAS